MVEIYTDSTSLCRTEEIVRQVLRRSWDRRKFFIAPESAKASVERIIISELMTGDQTAGSREVHLKNGRTITVEGALVNGDVLSFMRLAGRILESSGSRQGDLSDKVSMRNAVYRILTDHIGEFRTFGKLVGKYEYIDKLIDLLGDFARYGIDEDRLAAAFETAEGKERNVYSDKMHDFKLLSGYLSEMNDRYGLALMTDNIAEANKLLGRLAADRELLDSRRFRPLKKIFDSTFTVLGFGKTRTLTPEEMTFTALLSELGADISFFPVYPANAEDPAIFYSAGRIFTDTISRKIPGTVVRDISEFTGELPGYPDTTAAAAARKYSFSLDLSEQEEKSPDIVSASFESTDDRIAYVCNEIVRLTAGSYDEGSPAGDKLYRYRDIRIVCVDDAICSRLNSVMSVFGLDTFVDRQTLMANTPVFRYAVHLLNMELHNYSLGDVMRLLRTGLVPVRAEICDLFENYCVKANITGGSRMFDPAYYKSEGGYYMRGGTDGSIFAAAEYLWTEVVEKVLIPLREAAGRIREEEDLSGKAKLLAEHISGRLDIIKALAGSFSETNTEKAAALVNGYKELMKLLAVFTEPMNDVPVSLKNFVSLLMIDMRNKVQGTIPLNIDSVEITDTAGSHLTPCRVLFILDPRNDNFPYTVTTDGILSADELKMLSRDTGIDLPDKAQSKSREEFINSALMLSAVTDKVYFVRDYKARASSVQLFYEKFSDRSDVNNFKNPVHGRIPERRHDPAGCDIDMDLIRQLMKDGTHMSSSSVEAYSKCRLKYMLNSVLKIDKREDNRSVKPNIVGSILHDMLEKAIEKISSDRTASDLVTYAEELRADEAGLRALADETFDDWRFRSKEAAYHSDEFLRNTGRKTKRIFSYVLPYLLEEAGSGGYLPTGFEKKLEELPDPLRITTGSGIRFDFVGSIDRVDTNEATGDMRVIDYKSGSKDISIAKAFAGLQNQLFVYSGVLGKNIGDSKVADAGYVEIGLSSKKEGVNPKPKLASMTPEDMRTCEEYSEYLIRQACEDISEGKAGAAVNAASIYDGARECSLCPFAGMCGNDPKKPVLDYKGVHFHGKTKEISRQDFYIDQMKKRMSGEENT